MASIARSITHKDEVIADHAQYAGPSNSALFGLVNRAHTLLQQALGCLELKRCGQIEGSPRIFDQ
jgi:hypothetical protein